MPDTATRRVATTLELEIDRTTRPAGSHLVLPHAEADAMIAAGRAVEDPEPAPTEEAPAFDHHEQEG